MSAPQAMTPLSQPAIDAHVVADGARVELIDGVLVVTPPAEEPHGLRHAGLVHLLEAHVAEGYLVAVDLLSRLAEDQDFAPDVSVYPAQRDDQGKRRRDALSFEIVGEQTMAACGRKAAILCERGVRRVFGIDVDKNEVYEWDSALSVWRYLQRGDALRDAALVSPLPIAALLDTAEVDAAVVDALRAKKSPALTELQRSTFREGRREGRREGLEQGAIVARRAAADLCEVLSVPLTDARRAQLQAMTLPQLDALLECLKETRDWPEEQGS